MADEFTILHEPVSSIELMERASLRLFDWVRENRSADREFYIFCGQGNNGGDGLALARMLLKDKYRVKVFILKLSSSMSKDALINLERLRKVDSSAIFPIETENDFPPIPSGIILVDALFGSGLTRPLDGIAASLVKHINESREEILSVDMPSGLFGEDNRNNLPDNIIKATNTLTFQFPKLAFFFAENYQFTGDWQVLDIGLHRDYIEKTETPWNYLAGNELKEMVKTRKKFDHKGTYGHALLFSGSFGKTGAAVLAAKACLKAGCGLVTVHMPGSGYEVFQAALPEAMCSMDSDDRILTIIPELSFCDAIGIGPGIGTAPETCILIKELLSVISVPLVIDADAINIIAANKNLIDSLPENAILTPHPGEADRLLGKSASGYERFLKQIEFAIKYKVVVVLKGAFTSVALPDGRVFFNTTGNPGMATAGSGDVLTGIILSLLAQGYSPEHASIIGVYVHGKAGDLALKTESYESLIAGNIIDHLGKAFKELSVSF